MVDNYIDWYNYLKEVNKFFVPITYVVPNPTTILTAVPSSAKFFTVVHLYCPFSFLFLFL